MTEDKFPNPHAGIINTRGKGFAITFQNDWTISVQWGYGNYCENRNPMLSIDQSCPECQFESVPKSATVEIAIMDANDKWLDFGCDQVKGWVPVDELPYWISRTAAQTRHRAKHSRWFPDNGSAYGEEDTQDD